MTGFWNWVRTYVWVPLLFVIAFLAWMLGGRTTPLEQTAAELKAIRAGARVENIEARVSHEAARKHVQFAYEDEIKALNARQKARAEEMSNDPAKLARFLVRIGSRKS